MADRIKTMRTRLVEALVAAGSNHDWSHVTEQIGMFAFTGMSSDMCDELTEKYAIYLTRDGRISIAGTFVVYSAFDVHAISSWSCATPFVTNQMQFFFSF
jgi:aspartate aminotransferase